ncbi:MAG: pyridoxal-phosphate dependent enzyme [Candidatus Neomarinimicrobiota bacterium]
MQKVDNILQLIGRTPMVRINKLADPDGAELWAKLELFNPGGSVKDRAALRIIDDYEKEGRLKPGGTVVEATSGNMGFGLAMACAVRGYNAILAVLDKVSDEKRRLMEAMGAELVICPTAVAPDDPRSFYSVARRIAAETPGAVLINQYENPSNVQAHYDNTGPEIWEQMEGRIDALVASMGTGGTITGVAGYLKEKNPDIKVWAADPYGSIFKIYKETGEIIEGHPYLVEGIGEDAVPGIMDIELLDEIVNVSDGESFQMSRRMAREEGIIGGGSAGANMKVAVEVAAAMRPDQVVVTFIPDTGERYLSKIFSDGWMREKGLLSREMVSLRQLRQMKSPELPNIISANPTETVREVLNRMTSHNVSQLPILDEHRNIGSVRESSLLALSLEDTARLDQPVKEVMEEPFPVVDESASVAHAVPLLLKYQGVLLLKDGRPTGFITQYDVISYTDKQ